MQLKILPDIKEPNDIRDLSYKELSQLCSELREHTIKTITEIGGHLAPTLGVIEVTVALHYVYNTPKDKLIWDVGHQGYAHKLLTGRFEKFSTIRQFDGLSGFLKRSESEYDVIGAGHASTSISAALGIAEARRQKNENFRDRLIQYIRNFIFAKDLQSMKIKISKLGDHTGLIGSAALFK